MEITFSSTAFMVLFIILLKSSEEIVTFFHAGTAIITILFMSESVYNLCEVHDLSVMYIYIWLFKNIFSLWTVKHVWLCGSPSLVITVLMPWNLCMTFRFTDECFLFKLVFEKLTALIQGHTKDFKYDMVCWREYFKKFKIC